MITKIKIRNYKIFKEFEINVHEKKNILVGENGVGKSTLLEAISLVLNGSKNVVDSLGFQAMFNNNAVKTFFENEKIISNLPTINIELYLELPNNPIFESLYGKNNLLNKETYGIYMIVQPDLELYSQEIDEILSLEEDIFPYEFYKLQFKTFANTVYDSYSKKHKIRYEFIDSSKLNSKIGIKKFISNLFDQHANEQQKNQIRFEFRKQLNNFSNDLYDNYGLNSYEEYKIQTSNLITSQFDKHITAVKEDISIEQEGKGEQLILGIQSSLNSTSENVKIILIEEPENHLSYINMLKLIKLIEDSNLQLFISTHSNMIASRLEINNMHILSKTNVTSIIDISKQANRYFKKSPNTSLLDFILSKKAILVEGPAEFILMNKFYEIIHGCLPHSNDISIISVNGLNFKNYLELSKLLGIETLVITDNDKNYDENILKKYEEVNSFENIKIVSDINNDNHTFEVCIYNSNIQILDYSMKTKSMKNGLLEYMLNNKTEFAMRLLEKLENEEIEINIPIYIKEGLQWIKEK
ncbi:ATP-dependent nuclease [Macrococcus epidermidis]|uniref:ATP-dependent nuclease n=1 Tax=Macrococcus epidermidis TaxID=1902580 RepID=UPI0020B7901F|nr:TOPRIM nucleotidyl transferase/hydrolase domain-containing protein [Macrococcus epidermidis]UTH15631.1 AAA family ATPase [Macrococcus epidermidis]